MFRIAPATEARLLRRQSAAKPEAYLDHPWGEDVAKVGKKVFAFFGMPDGAEPGFGVKLPQSNSLALSQPGVTPTGYGLGASGWVSVRLTTEMPFEMLRAWIDESYQTIAPKKLAAISAGESKRT